MDLGSKQNTKDLRKWFQGEPSEPRRKRIAAAGSTMIVPEDWFQKESKT